MLNRIFLFTVISSAIAVWLLRAHFPILDQHLKHLDVKVNLGIVKEVNLSYLIPAILVAVLARIVKLHDRISDLLRIRARFDVRRILVPLAHGIGLKAEKRELSKIWENRRVLMRKAFYPYASSTDPKIDKHLIYQALDYWSWYWVLVESLVVWIATAVALLFAKEFVLSLSIFGGCVLVFAVMHPIIWCQCIRYAQDEVDAILADNSRKDEVKKAFTCVTGRLVT